MTFNASKCKVSNATQKKALVTHDYHLGNVILQRVQEEKDLGVTIISSNLSWDSHVMRIVLKANRILGLLKRTCPLVTDIMKLQLSYATEVWSPAVINLRTILERVQRRATRWILRTRIGHFTVVCLVTWP